MSVIMKGMLLILMVLYIVSPIDACPGPIDDIIVFHQLNNEDMKAIVNLLASDLYRRCEEQMDIHLTLTSSLKEHLVEKYADNKMGARPLKRALQSVVEDALAEEILMKKILPGDTVSAGFKGGKVVFQVKEK